MALDLRGYLQWRCSEMLVMERDMWNLRNLMARETHDARLKEALARDSEPIRQQISHLEQIVDKLGGLLGPDEHPVTQGMLRAHRQFMALEPSAELRDIHHALEADKIAHFTLSGYQALITLARHLGEEDIARVLQDDTQHDERMCTILEGLTPEVFSAYDRQARRAA
ncbi:MAG TPA: DUF892 family protein [Armatimonadota bacterium]